MARALNVRRSNYRLTPNQIETLIGGLARDGEDYTPVLMAILSNMNRRVESVEEDVRWITSKRKAK